jgi:hypothetical protein
MNDCHVEMGVMISAPAGPDSGGGQEEERVFDLYS